MHNAPTPPNKNNLENKIKKLAPQDGDIIVIKIPKSSTNETIRQIMQTMDKLSSNFNNLQTICIEENINLELIPEKEMNRIGWYRKGSNGK